MRSLHFETREGGVLLLTLSRGKGNRFDLELMQAVSAAIREAARSPATRALVLTGAGPCFSSGIDFRAMASARVQGRPAADRFNRAIRQMILDLWTCPRPTVAAVNGHAVAMGFLVAAACDFRFVLEGDAGFGLTELSFGGGFSTLALELGRHVLGRDLPQVVLGAERFDWRAGVRNGAFTRSFSDAEQLVEAAVARARALGKLPREAYAQAKAQLLAARVDRVRSESEEQRRRVDAIYESEESAAAMTAHMQRLLQG